MWDNPRQLNVLAGFLVGLVVLAFTLTALQLALRSPLWPIHEVTIQGDLQHTMRAEIEAALAHRVSGNFFSVDVEGCAARWSDCPGCAALPCGASGPTASRPRWKSTLSLRAGERARW